VSGSSLELRLHHALGHEPRARCNAIVRAVAQSLRHAPPLHLRGDKRAKDHAAPRAHLWAGRRVANLGWTSLRARRLPFMLDL